MTEYAPNKSFVLQKIKETSFEDRPVPELGDHDVLLEIKKTGICGSDVHYLEHGRIGDYCLTGPMVLGHESAGLVFKVGSKVKNVKPGDRVAVEPGASCRTCHFCKLGHYELCPDMVFAATPPYHGTLARYYKVPSDLVYPLPENMSLEEGAMMEPLSVAVHSVHTIANVRANQTVIIFGAGPVGLLCMSVARALGARRVIAVDIVQSRLDFALKFAATHIYLPGKPNEGETKIQHSGRIAKDMAEKLQLETIGRNVVDVVIDATGAPSCIQMGVLLIKAGGIFVQVGMGPSEVEFPVIHLIAKQIRYEGSFRYGAGDYEGALGLIASGKVDVKPLITHRYKFDEAATAFETTRAGKSEDGKAAIKVIIDGPE